MASLNCNPPDSAGFRTWFDGMYRNTGSDELRRAARCGWNAAMRGQPNDPSSMDHSAAVNAQGKPRAGAKDAFGRGWAAAAHRLEIAQKKRSPKFPAPRLPTPKPTAAAARSVAEQRESSRRTAARADLAADPRYQAEVNSAARQAIWAIAAADERAGADYLDVHAITVRLRDVSAADVHAVGGNLSAVKLYRDERRRVKAARKETMVLGRAKR